MATEGPAKMERVLLVMTRAAGEMMALSWWKGIDIFQELNSGRYGLAKPQTNQ